MASRSRPVLLDLFCGAGGAGYGYHQAGFEVVGVDNAPQPRYPFTFLQLDVMTKGLIPRLVEGRNPVAIHASPPCQRYSRLAYYQPEKIEDRYADLVGQTRELLTATGLPYVIENVPQAPLVDPVELCGCMFNGLMVYRPRRFELGFGGVWTPSHWRHDDLCSRNGDLPTAQKPRMTITGGKHSKAWQQKACAAMGVPWMAVPEDAQGKRVARGIREVCEAIPPAYTRHLGSQLIDQVPAEVAA